MSKIYPNAGEYVTAIENAKTFVKDPVLKDGVPEKDRRGELLVYAGGFARVFVIRGRDKEKYALRCWVSDIGEEAVHYRTISDYLGKGLPRRLPYFTEFAYLPEGILVNGVHYPILRMKWVDGSSLHEFIRDHKDQPQELRAAAENFLRMAQELHDCKIAHGDLQNDNLKVRLSGTTPEFVLIDYDTLFVPGREGKKVSTTGVRGFQHPGRSYLPTAIPEADYFSELVIYLTLHAIAVEPLLWSEYHMADSEKQLIFSGEDFDSKVPTERFRRLRDLGSPLVSNLTLLLWNFTRSKIEWLIPIEVAAGICRESPANNPWLHEWSGGGGKLSKFEDLLRPGTPSPPSTPPIKTSPSNGSFGELLRPGYRPTSTASRTSQKPPPLPPLPPLPDPAEPQKTRNDAILWWVVILVVVVLLLLFLSHSH
jgi:hypothetical protein